MAHIHGDAGDGLKETETKSNNRKRKAKVARDFRPTFRQIFSLHKNFFPSRNNEKRSANNELIFASGDGNIFSQLSSLSKRFVLFFCGVKSRDFPVEGAIDWKAFAHATCRLNPLEDCDTSLHASLITMKLCLMWSET